jgi:uncharacterized membrane protein YdbT with pleckstrin-like domain
MIDSEQLADPSLKDLAWAGYHPRAMIPAAVLAGSISLLLWTGKWFLEPLMGLNNRLGSFVVFAIAWGVWPGLIAVFLVRTVTRTYRLTDRALLIDLGYLTKPIPPISLHDIHEIKTGGNWLSRLLGVGEIEVRTGDRVIRLTGVRHPIAFAKQIQHARNTAQTVTG